MAEMIKEIKTRVALRTGDYAYWTTGAGKDIELYKGEVCVCTLAENTGKVVNAPTVLFKVCHENGKKFADLDWVSGLAADVYGWAKATEAEHIAWLKTNHADLDTRYSFSTEGDKLVVKKTLYTNGVAGTEEAVGEYEFLSEGEVRTILEGYYTKEEVDALIEGVKAEFPTELGVMSVDAANDAIEIGGTEKDPTVGVKLNPTQGNVTLTVEGGLKASVVLPTSADYGVLEIKEDKASGVVVDKTDAQRPIVKIAANTYDAYGAAAAVAEDLAEYQEAHKDDYTNAKIDEIVGAVEDKVDAIHVPVYSVTKDTAPGAYSAVYHLTRDGEIVGEAINIPKDMVVEDGKVVENPEGQPEGTYIKLFLQNVTDPLYINVSDLIEYVTSGSTANDQIIVDVSADHKVTATIGAGKVGTTELADDAVTAGKLADAINEDIAKGVTAHGWGNHADAGYAIEDSLGALAYKDTVATDDIVDKAITKEKLADAVAENIDNAITFVDYHQNEGDNEVFIRHWNQNGTAPCNGHSIAGSKDMVTVNLGSNYEIKIDLDNKVKTSLALADNAIQNLTSGTGIKIDENPTAEKGYTVSLNDASIASLGKANTALQEVEVGTGLTVTEKAENKQKIEIDENVVFVLNCNW